MSLKEEGRRMILGIAGTLIGLDFIAIALVLLTGSGKIDASKYIRTILTFGLAYGLYRRIAWIRWTTVVLSYIATVTTLIGIYPIIRGGINDPRRIIGLVALCLYAIAYLAAASLLAKSNRVKAYFAGEEVSELSSSQEP